MLLDFSLFVVLAHSSKYSSTVRGVDVKKKKEFSGSMVVTE